MRCEQRFHFVSMSRLNATRRQSSSSFDIQNIDLAQLVKHIRDLKQFGWASDACFVHVTIYLWDAEGESCFPPFLKEGAE